VERLLTELSYGPVHEQSGWVVYQHEQNPAQVFALDWSAGDMSTEHFLFVLEHNGESPDAAAAYLESL
jgi:hypothetical protein